MSLLIWTGNPSWRTQNYLRWDEEEKNYFPISDEEQLTIDKRDKEVYREAVTNAILKTYDEWIKTHPSS